MGMINYDEWTCPPFVGYFVDDLRMHHHDWPEKPTVRTEGQLRSEKMRKPLLPSLCRLERA